MRRYPVVILAVVCAFLVLGATSGSAARPHMRDPIKPFVADPAVPNTGLAPGGHWTSITAGQAHVTGTPVLTITGGKAAVCWGSNPTTGAACDWEGVYDTVDNVWIGAQGPAGSGPIKLWPFDCALGSDIGGLWYGPGEPVWIGWVSGTTDPDFLPLVQKQLLQYDCSGGGGGSVFPVPGGSATLATSAGTVSSASGGAIDPNNIPAGWAFPYGSINFTVTGLTPGATITVTLTLPGPVTKYFKYQNGVYSQFPGATFSGNEVVLTLTDGGSGDGDQTPGSITDPGLPAIPVRCPAGVTARILSASTNAGAITGVFCVNRAGIGTYTQDGRIAPAQIIKVGNILWFQANGNNLRNSGYFNTANGASSFVQTKPISATGKVTSLT